MPKYITVLNASANQNYWIAVQEGENIADIKNNKYYSADHTQSITKNESDAVAGTTTITEQMTGQKAQGTIIRLASVSQHLIALSRNKATASFVKKIEKTLQKHK
jgi:hypothetical protein